MKKFLSAILIATLLCTTLMVSPVSASWDRSYFNYQGTNGYVYCSTGTDSNYPPGYGASVQDDNYEYRDLGLELTYYILGGGSGTRTAYDNNYYLFIEGWGTKVTNATCLVSVDGASRYYYARG